MITHKYIQLIGNMAANNLVRRYPQLDIKFFSGKRGDMMRIYIMHREDDRQLTGRLYDIETNPGIETRWVKSLADRIEGKMHDHVTSFLASATPPETAAQVETPQAAAAETSDIDETKDSISAASEAETQPDIRLTPEARKIISDHHKAVSVADDEAPTQPDIRLTPEARKLINTQKPSPADDGPQPAASN